MEQPFDAPEHVPPTPKMPLARVVGINFAITLAYLALSGVGQGEAALGSLLIDAFLLLAQVAVNLIAGLAFIFQPEKRQLGRALLLAGLLVGIIGFGMCMGKYSVFG